MYRLINDALCAINDDYVAYENCEDCPYFYDCMEEEDEYEEEEKMSIAKCLYCETELEIDESYDFSVEYGYAINRVAGHCPNCNKEFQWEEIYKYYSCEKLEEVN